jgi:hypothetical protein
MHLFLQRLSVPWFLPARPPGRHAVVEARRTVRWHFGRETDPVRRKLVQLRLHNGLAPSGAPACLMGSITRNKSARGWKK